MALRFEWDPVKAKANERKHGVSFDEAASVFWDDNAMVIADPDRGEGEERFVIRGLSAKTRVLIVCHCLREHETVIRIISARRASVREQREYRESLT
jgi:hypothetical protein